MALISNRIASPSWTFNLINGSVSFAGPAFGRKKKACSLTPSALDTAGRVRRVLEGHQVSDGAALSMVPPSWGWTHGTFSTDEGLLGALGPEQLDWLADTFGVQRAWLNGDEVPIFQWPAGYKAPERFVKHLRDRGWVTSDLRMIVLAADYKKGMERSLDHFTIVFSHPIGGTEEAESPTCAHVNFDCAMRWDHGPCARDAMVLARWYHEQAVPFGAVPIIGCSHSEIDAVAEGEAFPGPLISFGGGGRDQLQDGVIPYSVRGQVKVRHPFCGLEEALVFGREIGLLEPQAALVV